MDTDKEHSSRDPLADQASDDTDQTRRNAVVRLAKYTAPAMLALLLSDKAAVAS
jgi:hypothetical protein